MFKAVQAVWYVHIPFGLFCKYTYRFITALIAALASLGKIKCCKEKNITTPPNMYHHNIPFFLNGTECLPTSFRPTQPPSLKHYLFSPILNLWHFDFAIKHKMYLACLMLEFLKCGQLVTLYYLITTVYTRYKITHLYWHSKFYPKKLSKLTG